MSRIIKFRAWDKDKKEMIYPESQRMILVPTMESWGIMEYDHIEGCCGSLSQFCFGNADLLSGRWVEMQFTGLKDKNGKEIYEGDIVTRNKAGMVWLVEFWVDGGGWILKDKNNSLPGGVGLYQEQIDSDLKVIGNIYENHELLEIKKQNEKI